MKTLKFKILFAVLSLWLRGNDCLFATDISEGDSTSVPAKYFMNTSFFSPNIIVSFFSKYNSEEHHYKPYKVFSVVSTMPFEGVEWLTHDENSYYYLLEGKLDDYTVLQDGENGRKESSPLLEMLSCLSRGAEKIYTTHYGEGREYDETNLERFLGSVGNADVVFFSFGAGISHGYVPTLEESCDELGLIKIPSSDQVTDKSMQDFVCRLIKEPKTLLSIIRESWSKIDSCEIRSTPAHLALFNFINCLKKDGKEVFVYTDNIDGIHRKCGIDLSRNRSNKAKDVDIDSTVPYVSFETLLYPTLKDVEGQNVVSVLIGQSFDFDFVLGHLYEIAPHTQFFSINIKGDPLKIFTGLDMNNLPEEEIDLLTVNKITLPDVLLLRGSAHEILPKIVEKYEDLKTKNL